METDNNMYIYATALKGFCSVETCWRFLRDISGALLNEVREVGKSYALTLDEVCVEGHAFMLGFQSKEVVPPETQVWQLGAAAFELMLGLPIFNGKGETLQKADTPIPLLPMSDAAELNLLLGRCIDFHPERRPDLTEILQKADAELKRLEKIPTRKKRIHSSVRREEVIGDFDRQWPEQMVSAAKSLLLLLVLILSLPLSAQNLLDQNGESETFKMLKAVLLLRHHDTKSWNAAQDDLSKRITLFTMMDELKDRQNDCALVSSQIKNTFGLNRIINELKKGRRVQNTGKELLDGADSRFKYSMFEKGIKKGATATYRLSGRSGKQVFVIVPFDARQNFSCQLKKANGTVFQPTGKDKDGIVYFIIPKADGPKQGETLSLSISNQSAENASFVVINHNHRD